MKKQKDDATTKDRKGQVIRREPVKDFFKDVVFVLVSFFFLHSFVLASFEVPTGSMENEIMTGDFLFVNKFLYGGTTPRTIPFTDIRLPWFRMPAVRDVHRGDVIVFEFPGAQPEIVAREFQFYLKRAIALSGDTVQIIRRTVYVNGEKSPIPRNIRLDSPGILPPSAIENSIFPPGAPYNQDNWGPVVVPGKGDVIGLSVENFERWRVFIGREGHHASLGQDGSVFIDNKQVTSYTVERNYLFGMGDHRDNSLDSRFWGFIPEQNIVGTPMIVYWSWDPEISMLAHPIDKLASIRLGRIGTIIR